LLRTHLALHQSGDALALRPREVSVTATISIVPPVQCTPWCTDGTGHPYAEEPADQSCHGAEQRIELAATPAHLSGRVRGHLVVQLFRDVYPASGSTRTVTLEPPHVEVCSSGTEVIALSLGEAHELGELLIQLADAGNLA
jgi:hypothetical protein